MISIKFKSYIKVYSYDVRSCLFHVEVTDTTIALQTKDIVNIQH
jgi:hypothetical protein